MSAPPSWLHQIAEKYGYNPWEAPGRRILSSVFQLLIARTESDLGFVYGETDDYPQFCDFAERQDWHDAQERWVRDVCAMPQRATNRDELVEWLTQSSSAEAAPDWRAELENAERLAAQRRAATDGA